MSELAKINACAKRPIDIWTNYLYYPFSIRLVYLIRKTNITPNQLTIFSLMIALIGCFSFAIGTRSAVIVGLVLVQISYVFDCADGQLARYKQQYSPIGGWLDQVADRVKEFAVYFSLAYGYSRFHTSIGLWMWAMVALFVLFLLEYYGQIGKSLPQQKQLEQATDATASTADDAAQSTTTDTFSKLQRYRSFLPFRGFIIGEQYFAMLIFLVFGGIQAFFVFVAILGLLMSVYRPVIEMIKRRRSGIL